MPARVQEALGELVGAAREGSLALSLRGGPGVLAELMEEEVVDRRNYWLRIRVTPDFRKLLDVEPKRKRGNMSGVAQVRSLFGRKRSPRLIHPEEWPEQSGKARVLIENPDRADLWAHAELLREAGYDVTTCVGLTAETEHVPWFRRWADPQPMERQERTLCPLIADGIALLSREPTSLFQRLS